jgi:hypothetical protein
VREVPEREEMGGKRESSRDVRERLDLEREKEIKVSKSTSRE